MDLTIPYAPTGATTLTVTAPLAHVCPVVQEADYGSVTITYKPATALLELHALAALLRSYADQVTTHEALTAQLKATLADALRPEALSVVTSWTTAGLAYQVAA
jgi:NADPH-dependent 7-cyano-7-deazaguanine reductase QueF